MAEIKTTSSVGKKKKNRKQLELTGAAAANMMESVYSQAGICYATYTHGFMLREAHNPPASASPNARMTTLTTSIQHSFILYCVAEGCSGDKAQWVAYHTQSTQH